MRRVVPLLVLAVLFALVSPTPAHAILMRVDFSVLADPVDPVNAGQTASGYFTFDSGIIPSIVPATLYNYSGLGVSDFFITWDGHTWTTADADVLDLTFDARGNLYSWHLGGVPAQLSTVSAVVYPDIFASSTGAFIYSTATSPLYHSPYSGTVTSWSVAPAPAAAEPGTLALLVPGLLPLGLMLRRRKKS